MPTTQTTNETTATKPTQTDSDTAKSDLATMQLLGLQRMSGMSAAWVEMMSDMGSEVVSFVAERIREDVKTQHQILHCKDVKELQKIQSDFIQKAVEQYTEETGRLVEMSKQMFSPPGNGTKRG